MPTRSLPGVVSQLTAKKSRKKAEVPRERRLRPDIRETLLEAGIAEFASKGFEGASTLAIAKAAKAHQPQINYHFGSKLDLWKAVVDRLYGELSDEIRQIDFETDLGSGFAEFIRCFAEFAATRPKLFQILLHELAVSEQQTWVYEKYQQPRYKWLKAAWIDLQELGVAAPIDPRLIFHHLVGAASMLYIAEAEAGLMLADVDAEDIRQAHVDGLIATFLPGLSS